MNFFITIILFFSFFLFITAVYYDKKNRILGRYYQIPHGKVLYSDLLNTRKVLFSKKLLLKGKPDYILKTRNGKIIPIEVKTGNHITPKPYHIMQLIAYCHLVSEAYQQKVVFGILIYYDTKKQFQIPFNKKYYTMLKSTIDLMNDHLSSNIISRNHNDFEKCLHCTMRSYCSEKIK